MRLLSFLLLCTLLFPAGARAQDPAIASVRLANGLHILCRQETGAPLVAMDIFVRNDDALARAPGLGSLLARSLLASTSNVTAETFATQLGDLGGNITAAWQADAFQISALVVKDRFRETSFLLSDVLRNADFDPQGTSVDDARQQLLSDIDGAGSGTFQTAYAAVRKVAYAGSPYALPALGDTDTVSRLTRNDLVRAYDRVFVPANMTIVVVGDIDPQYAVTKITDDMTDFPTQGRGTSRPPEAVAAPEALTADPAPVRLTLPDLSEVAVMIGYQTPAASSPDYPALLVANSLLGGMKTSRLFTALREKRGLGYAVGSLLNTQSAAGDLSAYALAAPTRTDPVTKKTVSTIGLLKRQILRQCDSLKAVPPTDAELRRAQHYLIGSDQIRRERMEDRATLLGQETLQNGDAIKFEAGFARRLKAVTPDDIQRVAQRYFVHPIVVVVSSSATADTPDIPDSEATQTE